MEILSAAIATFSSWSLPDRYVLGEIALTVLSVQLLIFVVRHLLKIVSWGGTLILIVVILATGALIVSVKRPDLVEDVRTYVEPWR